MNTDVKMPLAVHKGSGGLMRVQDVPRGLDCCCACWSGTTTRAA